MEIRSKKRIGVVTAIRFKRDIAGKDQWHILNDENKTFQNVDHYYGKKSPQKYWHITNPKLQHFFVMMWKMMDIVASRKC